MRERHGTARRGLDPGGVFFWYAQCLIERSQLNSQLLVYVACPTVCVLEDLMFRSRTERPCMRRGACLSHSTNGNVPSIFGQRG